jgi:predicted MFS family arabinose efflux permease
MRAEKQGKIRSLLIASIVVMMISQAYFSLILRIDLKGTYYFAFGLLVFFVGFNLLEALQPSLVSRLAGDLKGTALGIYNTTQSLGLFLGGLVGGWIIGHWGPDSVFHVDIVLIGVWLIIAWSMSEVPGRQKAA